MREKKNEEEKSKAQLCQRKKKEREGKKGQLYLSVTPITICTSCNNFECIHYTWRLQANVSYSHEDTNFFILCNSVTITSKQITKSFQLVQTATQKLQQISHTHTENRA